MLCELSAIVYVNTPGYSAWCDVCACVCVCVCVCVCMSHAASSATHVAAETLVLSKKKRRPSMARDAVFLSKRSGSGVSKAGAGVNTGSGSLWPSLGALRRAVAGGSGSSLLRRRRSVLLGADTDVIETESAAPVLEMSVETPYLQVCLRCVCMYVFVCGYSASFFLYACVLLCWECVCTHVCPAFSLSCVFEIVCVCVTPSLLCFHSLDACRSSYSVTVASQVQS